jgi:hypothetical protein
MDAHLDISKYCLTTLRICISFGKLKCWIISIYTAIQIISSKKIASHLHVKEFITNHLVLSQSNAGPFSALSTVLNISAEIVTLVNGQKDSALVGDSLVSGSLA